jgi:hypothetical protein
LSRFINVLQGVAELKRELSERAVLTEMPEIHQFLDGFYLSRIGIRILIGENPLTTLAFQSLFNSTCLAPYVLVSQLLVFECLVALVHAAASPMEAPIRSCPIQQLCNISRLLFLLLLLQAST